MRLVLAAVFVCGLLGCSAAPTQWQPPACNHDSRDCSPDAVRARVIEAFPDVKVQEVLACTDKPTELCYSSEQDHEACLVRLEGQAIAGQVDTKGTGYYPLVRALVGQDEPRYPLLVRRQRQGRIGLREESIYVNGPGNLAVLYLADARCFDISEIT